ncbi:MAG: ABC transporter permease [Spirochaetales bacterium]|nr:ABC transporter permease [Spirochaetales bacterium]
MNNPESNKIKIESPMTIAWKRFRQNKLAIISAYILLVIVIFAFGAPLFTRYSPIKIDLGNTFQAPSHEHIFGTDDLGRDVFSRSLYGGRVSLLVGLTAAAISTAIGVLLGSIAGYFGKTSDQIIMRFTDVMMTFPPIIIMLTIAAITGPGLINVILIIGGLRWPATTRLVRGEFLSLTSQDFVIAANAMGLPDYIIIGRHCLPNVVAPLMARISFSVSAAILSEAGLSFLGIGVPLPTPSWGNMMTQARDLQVLHYYPWMWLFPAIFVLITIMCINFIGDGLRDAFDPKQILF